MIPGSKLLPVACSLFLTSSLWADTLTLRNHSEINGHVQYADGTFSVEAKYSKGPKTWAFDRTEVLTLEFNDRDFNTGAPPSDISVFAAHTSILHNASNGSEPEHGRETNAHNKAPNSLGHPVLSNERYNPSTEDIIWLRDKSKLAGRLVRIEANHLTIQTQGKGKKLEAGKVTTILIAPN
jgi:hypothetical protein